MTKPRVSLSSRFHGLSLRKLLRIEIVVLASWSVLSLAVLLLVAETRTNDTTVPPEQQQLQTTPTPRQHHKLFILVGAVRTLEQTAPSILHNVIYRTCSPDQGCTAHVVTHFSYTDNRPDKDGNDPKGRIVDLNANNRDFFHSHAPDDVHQPHLRMYVVKPAYNTGSLQEQAAMDMVQNEYDRDDYTQTNTSHTITSMAQRMKIWRSGDPRRFSMWFARYWAWRFVQQNLLSQYSFDLIAFLRPDMYWFQPLPSDDFFVRTPTQSDLGTTVTVPSYHDLWIHDSYYAYIPDTFAFMVSTEMAERYFSLTRLLTPGVACLGGPNFDHDLVKTRLIQQGLVQNDTVTSHSNRNVATSAVDRLDPWCADYNAGFSEHILLRKMRRANVFQRYMPAGAALLRPPHALDCQPLFMFLRAPQNRHAQNVAAPMACVAHKRAIAQERQRPQHLVQRNNDTIPYQLVERTSPHWCLTRMYDHLRNSTSSEDSSNGGDDNETNEHGPLFIKKPCAIPYSKTQLFVGHKSRLKIPSWGFATEKFNFRLDPLDVQLLPSNFTNNEYYEKPCELYSKALLQEMVVA